MMTITVLGGILKKLGHRVTSWRKEEIRRGYMSGVVYNVDKWSRCK